jgi:hypothetical protein
MASVYAAGGSSGSNARSSQLGPLSFGLVRPIKTRVRCLQPFRCRHIARHASWMNSRLFSGFIGKFLAVCGSGQNGGTSRCVALALRTVLADCHARDRGFLPVARQCRLPGCIARTACRTGRVGTRPDDRPTADWRVPHKPIRCRCKRDRARRSLLRPDHQLLLLMCACDLKFVDRLGQCCLLIDRLHNAVHSRRGGCDPDYLRGHQLTLTLCHVGNMARSIRLLESVPAEGGRS